MTSILSGFPGSRYGAWTIVKEAEPKIYSGKKFRQVLARCDCGFEKVLHFNNLRQGKTKKCYTCSKVKHGFSGEPEYNIWDSMLARCNNPNNAKYKDYGGRGVTVCDRWNPRKGGSFKNFISDMGRRPGPLYQLDKEAVRLNCMIYGPETTRWVPMKENQRRKRNTIYLAYMGEVLSLPKWAEKTGLPPNAIRLRVRSGWSVERTLTQPLSKKQRRAKPKPSQESVVTARV
jgi:hypothetical protein